jgi:membrane protein
MTDAPAPADDARPAAGATRGRGWWRLVVNLYREMGQDHVGLIAAGVAFYGLLAIFPGIVAVMAIAGLVIEPSTVVTQLEGLTRFVPQRGRGHHHRPGHGRRGSEEGGLGLAAFSAFSSRSTRPPRGSRRSSRGSTSPSRSRRSAGSCATT